MFGTKAEAHIIVQAIVAIELPGEFSPSRTGNRNVVCFEIPPRVQASVANDRLKVATRCEMVKAGYACVAEIFHELR